MNTFSNWRSVRMWESRVASDLRQQRLLWLHGLSIGLITLAVTWGVSAMQMHLGSESLALRYLVSLGFGYLVYLLTVRMWAAALIRRNDQLGATIDHFIPTAQSLPQALKILKSQGLVPSTR